MRQEGRVVLHVDMDAFYAGVEARDNPALRGLPLVVGSDPQGGRGRGVVCTASYEARRFGIRSAMPISTAFRLAPHATYVRPDFTRYSEASRAVMAVLARYADVLEVVGMDEAYLDVTTHVLDPITGRPDWDLARSFARSLQAAVRRATGLSCSVGAAPCKSAAKVASDRHKPHGVTVVPPEKLAHFYAPLSPSKLSGCGPKTSAALREAGIVTIAQLAATSVTDLEAKFGSQGVWLSRIANGADDRPVDGASGERKSRSSEHTYLHDETQSSVVTATARELLESLLREHAAHDTRPFATLTVKLRYSDFTTFTRAHTVQVPLEAGPRECDEAAQALVAGLLTPHLGRRSVRLVGVRLSGFVQNHGQQSLAAYGLAGTASRLVAHGPTLGLTGPRLVGMRWTSIVEPRGWVADCGDRGNRNGVVVGAEAS